MLNDLDLTLETLGVDRILGTLGRAVSLEPRLQVGGLGDVQMVRDEK